MRNVHCVDQRVFMLKILRIPTKYTNTDESEIPEVQGETETYCNRCAWHDKLKALR
jgi:hypothetical protein